MTRHGSDGRWEKDVILPEDVGDLRGVLDPIQHDKPSQSPPKQPESTVYVLSVDYDEGHPETYRGVKLSKVSGDKTEEIKSYKTYFNQDWVEASNYCSNNQFEVTTAASVHNYNMDVKRLSGR